MPGYGLVTKEEIADCPFSTMARARFFENVNDINKTHEFFMHRDGHLPQDWPVKTEL